MTTLRRILILVAAPSILAVMVAVGVVYGISVMLVDFRERFVKAWREA